MEVHFIDFESKTIIYRPLRRLAFVGNRAMVNYIRASAGNGDFSPDPEVEAFLEAIGFREPDPAPPTPWLPGAAHRPTTAVLLMTNACNLRCTYCYARGGEAADLWMTKPLARAVIDAAWANAKDLGQSFFSLAFHGGGEPTLNWDVLVDAVAHAEAKDLPCTISMASNGMWTAAQRDFILNHFHGLSLSFDGMRRVQDTQRPRADGQGSYDAVMETIGALDAADLDYGIRLTTLPATVCFLAQSIAMLCRRTRCAMFQVEPCYTTARGAYADPTPRQAAAFCQAFLKAFEIAAAHGRTLFYSGARPWLITGSFCRAPQDALIVTPQGDIVTCFEAHDRRHPLARGLTIGRADAAGVHFDMDKLNADAQRRGQQGIACQDCFCHWHCGGDCTSRCLLAARQHRGRCEVNRTITKELLAWYLAAGQGVWQGEDF